MTPFEKMKLGTEMQVATMGFSMPLDSAVVSTVAETVSAIAAKPQMPAHDYATQWARDTLSGHADGTPFEWGDRNMSRSYLALRRLLEQAQDCIRGETPEDCTPDEARADTLEKIRDALLPRAITP